MISIFPNYLILQAGGYSTSFDKGIYRTEMENGPAKTRNFKCRTMKIYNLKYHICSIDNKLSFESWWKNDIKMGALWFLWTDLESKAEYRARLRSEPQFDLKASTMEKWELTIQLEIWI